MTIEELNIKGIVYATSKKETAALAEQMEELSRKLKDSAKRTSDAEVEYARAAREYAMTLLTS